MMFSWGILLINPWYIAGEVLTGQSHFDYSLLTLSFVEGQFHCVHFSIIISKNHRAIITIMGTDYALG